MVRLLTGWGYYLAGPAIDLVSEMTDEPVMDPTAPVCIASPVTSEELAKYFHQNYEQLAPHFGYKTREASAVPWEDVPEMNKNLMVTVCHRILEHFFPEHIVVHHGR